MTSRLRAEFPALSRPPTLGLEKWELAATLSREE